MRELNQRVVLERLRSAGAASRPRIAADTGLSKPTVGQALLGLERAGLVRTAGHAAGGQGRAAMLYEANPAAGHVLGIDIGRQRIRVAVADLVGEVVARLDEDNRCQTASKLVRTVRACADRAVADAGLRQADVVATVVGSPGVPDVRSAALHRAPNLPGWERKGLLNDLTTALGSGLVVENDANLAAIGEHTTGAARGVGVAVYLLVGTGIGMGIVINGALFRGAHGAAGEIGYLPFGWPSPEVPAQSRQGMLESAVSADAVMSNALAHGLAAVRTAKDVFDLARAGDAGAMRAVDEEASRLAFAVSSVVAVVDPELVVLGGGIGSNADLLVEPMCRALAGCAPRVPDIVAGELGDEAVLAGAVATALGTAREAVLDRAGLTG
ncbi:MAG: ROK family protein [Kutzneria sp.]|nr:ROK family protein [Kutzneria sp.]